MHLMHDKVSHEVEILQPNNVFLNKILLKNSVTKIKNLTTHKM